MATAAMATNRVNFNWVRSVLKLLYSLILAILILAYIIYDLPWWISGLWLIIGGVLVLTSKSDKRNFYLFIFFNLILMLIIGAEIEYYLVNHPDGIRWVENDALLDFLMQGDIERRFWTTVIGLIIAFVGSFIILLPIAFVSAIFVLALHQVDGINWWDATRYVLTLILGINEPFIVVENGQALITKEASSLAKIGGPGQLIIKEGNVVVLEQGGKISRVVNAGVVKLRKMERLRNIFILSGQSNSDEITHILTKDRIPLKINMSIAFQIEPAAEAEKRPESRMAPNGEALTKKLDDGMFQVYEGTIRKAALMSQSTSIAQRYIEQCNSENQCHNVEETTWKVGVPQGDLRDYIMTYRFDELFELTEPVEGAAPSVRVDKRRIYEIEQAILEKIKPGKAMGLGIQVKAVDIGKIVFPEDAGTMLLDYWKEPWRQDKQFISVEGRVRRVELHAREIVIEARARAQARILEGQGEGEARAAFFREVLREIKREATLGNEDLVIEVLKNLINSSMVSVKDLYGFVTATTRINRSSVAQLSAMSESHSSEHVNQVQVNGNGGEPDRNLLSS